VSQIFILFVAILPVAWKDVYAIFVMNEKDTRYPKVARRGGRCDVF